MKLLIGKDKSDRLQKIQVFIQGQNIDPLPITIATGGTPESSLKAGALGLPITYAIIGGDPKRFKRNIDMYKSIAESYGHDIKALPIATHS